MIVGASGADNNGRTDSGSAYVVYGQSTADPADLDLATVTTTDTGRGFRIDGQAASDRLALRSPPPATPTTTASTT